MARSARSMTLVFDRTAVERLADPPAAFEDARTWADAIGLVGEVPSGRLADYAERLGLEPDLLSSGGGRSGALVFAREKYETERYVFVGTADADRELAGSLGWEYLDVAEAAAAAGWSLVEPVGG